MAAKFRISPKMNGIRIYISLGTDPICNDPTIIARSAVPSLRSCASFSRIRRIHYEWIAWFAVCQTTNAFCQIQLHLLLFFIRLHIVVVVHRASCVVPVPLLSKFVLWQKTYCASKCIVIYAGKWRHPDAATITNLHHRLHSHPKRATRNATTANEHRVWVWCMCSKTRNNLQGSRKVFSVHTFLLSTLAQNYIPSASVRVSAAHLFILMAACVTRQWTFTIKPTTPTSSAVTDR